MSVIVQKAMETKRTNNSSKDTYQKMYSQSLLTNNTREIETSNF